ncbi:MAG: cytochrome c [gamma proteobacterium symbiont of Taylorina sp.]|nr:cytochrome c [gamma proteobacterium symbiont of Taylorina sp.]
MKKPLFLMLISTITLSTFISGCSRDYTPAVNATGEEIFKGACMECHEVVEGKSNVYYELDEENKNIDFFSKKISSGSLLMPKFPNITTDKLTAVSQYALDHSIKK